MEPDLIKLLIAIASGLIGVFFGHYLTKDRDTRTREAILDREAEIRRRDFNRIITKWRCKLIYSDRSDGTVTPRPTFNQAITEIMAEFALCGADFKRQHVLIKDAIRVAAAITDADIDGRIRSNKQKSHGEAFAAELQQIAEATQQ